MGFSKNTELNNTALFKSGKYLHLLVFHFKDLRIYLIRLENTTNEAVKATEAVMATESATWSDWVNTTKTATGSWALADHRKLCNNYTSIRIECTTSDGKNAETTGENFECDINLGFVCRNIEQEEGVKKCSDYRFRLRCSKTDKLGKMLMILKSVFHI